MRANTEYCCLPGSSNPSRLFRRRGPLSSRRRAKTRVSSALSELLLKQLLKLSEATELRFLVEDSTFTRDSACLGSELFA